ncbi:MAG TPA: hypothetical protein VF041_23025 [Gemmatimonadaceae bacterium]
MATTTKEPVKLTPRQDSAPAAPEPTVPLSQVQALIDAALARAGVAPAAPAPQPAVPGGPVVQFRALDERADLRVLLPRLSRKADRRGLDPTQAEYLARLGKGDDDRYAQFRGGKFVTSDEATIAELRRQINDPKAYAPFYEDMSPDVYTCREHGFMTPNLEAWKRHEQIYHAGRRPVSELFAPEEGAYEYRGVPIEAMRAHLGGQEE